MADGVLRVCALYPDLMNIYADRGNLTVLERRCAWRGIGFALSGAGIGDVVFQPAAVRGDDHLVAGAAQDAHEIERARIGRPRVQRRRKHEHGQRPREHDDLANGLR